MLTVETLLEQAVAWSVASTTHGERKYADLARACEDVVSERLDHDAFVVALGVECRVMLPGAQGRRQAKQRGERRLHLEALEPRRQRVDQRPHLVVVEAQDRGHHGARAAGEESRHRLLEEVDSVDAWLEGEDATQASSNQILDLLKEP